MDITDDQQPMSLEIISKLVYSRSEDEYWVFHHQLKGTKLKLVNEYLKNTGMKLEYSGWRSEKSDEIFNEQDQQQGLVYKPENQKVFGKEFQHYYFVQDLMTCLDFLALKRGYRAVTFFQKAPVQLYDPGTPLHIFQELFTSFAFSYYSEVVQLNKEGHNINQ